MDVGASIFLTVEQALRRCESFTPPSDPAIRLCHVNNPYLSQAGSEHDRAQKITFASMRAARDAAAADPDLTVRQVAVHYPEDQDAVPNFFDQNAILQRSVNDVVAFEAKRKLPLLWDMIQLGAEMTEADAPANDYLIYTNTDIALMPHFYTFVAQFLRRGLDVLVINRRTISGFFDDPEQLPLMYGEIGRRHVGFDCYIVRRDLLDGFVDFATCIGISSVTQPLMYNLVAATDRIAVLLDAHATFHVGDDQTWKKGALADYTAHNRAEVLRAFKALAERPGVRERVIGRLIGHTEYFLLDGDLRKECNIPRTGLIRYKIRQRLRKHFDWGREH